MEGKVPNSATCVVLADCENIRTPETCSSADLPALTPWASEKKHRIYWFNMTFASNFGPNRTSNARNHESLAGSRLHPAQLGRIRSKSGKLTESGPTASGQLRPKSPRSQLDLATIGRKTESTQTETCQFRTNARRLKSSWARLEPGSDGHKTEHFLKRQRNCGHDKSLVRASRRSTMFAQVGRVRRMLRSANFGAHTHTHTSGDAQPKRNLVRHKFDNCWLPIDFGPHQACGETLRPASQRCSKVGVRSGFRCLLRNSNFPRHNSRETPSFPPSLALPGHLCMTRGTCWTIGRKSKPRRGHPCRRTPIASVQKSLRSRRPNVEPRAAGGARAAPVHTAAAHAAPKATASREEADH